MIQNKKRLIHAENSKRVASADDIDTAIFETFTRRNYEGTYKYRYLWTTFSFCLIQRLRLFPLQLLKHFKQIFVNFVRYQKYLLHQNSRQKLPKFLFVKSIMQIIQQFCLFSSNASNQVTRNILLLKLWENLWGYLLDLSLTFLVLKLSTRFPLCHSISLVSCICNAMS